MSEKYLFFNSTQTDRRRHQASDMADYWNSFLSTGLINENENVGLQVVANGTNRIVKVKGGRALIDGHLYINDNEIPLRIEEADAVYDRIDRIVLRYDNSIENRYIKVFVSKGEANENPVPPQLVRGGDIYELSLAQIRVVGGKSFIEQKDITDERLNEDVCGLASSLVSVPTDVFDERFNDYMKQIEQEWQNWFNSVASDTYVTNTEYKAHNRDVDRQLANFNAIADIDNKAIGNTGKFYDLFAGVENQLSAARMDVSRATVKGSINAGMTQLVIFGSNMSFEQGEEVNIVGTETVISSEITVIQAIVRSFNANVLVLEEPIASSLTEGAVIFRSLVDSNNFPEDKVSILGWTNASVDPTILFNDASSNTYAGAVPTSCATREGYNFIVCGVLNLITYDEETDTYAKSAQLDGYNGLGESYNITPDGKFIMCFTGSSSSDSTTYKMQLVTPLSKTNTQLTATAGIGSTAWGGNSNLSLSSGVALEMSAYWVRDGKSYFANVDSFLSTNSLRVYEFNEGTKGWVLFATFQIKNSSVSCLDSWQNGEEILVFANSGNRIARYKIDYLNKEIKLVENLTTAAYATSYKNKVCVVNNKKDMFVFFTTTATYICRLGTDGKLVFSQTGTKLSNIIDTYLRFDPTDTYLVSQTYVYAIINNDFVSLYNALAVPSTWGKWYMGTGKNLYKIKAESTFGITPTMRYNFNQPTKNLAGWLTTDKEATTLDVQLSQVDVNGVESFTPLPVTKNGTEYEFMKVDNLYEKARTTLKITMDTGTKPTKLLGAIE